MSQQFLDPVQLGRALRAARRMKGYESGPDACAKIKQVTGVAISAQALYRVERGSTAAPFEMIVAAIATFRPPGGIRFFLTDAVQDEKRELVMNAVAG